MIKFSDDHLINIFSDFSLTLSMICVSYFFVYVGNNIDYPSGFWKFLKDPWYKVNLFCYLSICKVTYILFVLWEYIKNT